MGQWGVEMEALKAVRSPNLWRHSLIKRARDGVGTMWIAKNCTRQYLVETIQKYVRCNLNQWDSFNRRKGYVKTQYLTAGGKRVERTTVAAASTVNDDWESRGGEQATSRRI